MAEGNIIKAKIVVTAPGVKETFDQVGNAAKEAASDFGEATTPAKNLGQAFADLKAKGVVSLGSIKEALSQFKEALHVATDPHDIEQLNKAIALLTREQKKLLDSGVEGHLEGVSRGSQKAGNSALGLAKIFSLFPQEAQHLTHSLDGIVQSYEQIRAKTASSKEAFLELGKAFIGPLGIATAVTVVISLFEQFGGELFNSKEATERSAEALKAYGEQVDDVKEKIEGLESALAFANKLGSINIKVNKGTALQDLREQSVAQSDLTGQLTAERQKLFNNISKINNDIELSDEDRVKAAENNTKALADIEEKILQSTREQRIIYREIALQKVEDQEKANEKSLRDNEKYQRDFINAVKKTASLLANSTIRNVDFKEDPFGTLEENFNKAKETLKRINSDRSSFKIKIGAFVELDAFKGQDAVKKAFKDFEKDAPEFFRGLEKEIANYTKKNPILLQAQLFLDENKLRGETFLKIQEQLVGAVKNTLFEGLGDALGDAISGINPGKAIINTIASIISQIGKALIQLGLVKNVVDKIKAAFAKTPAAFIIGAGIAALAVAKALKGLDGARALGGPVRGGGSYLVGEKGPEIFTPNTGGRIIPNNLISAGMSRINSMASKVLVEGVFLVRGTDLQLAISNTNKSQGRLS